MAKTSTARKASPDQGNAEVGADSGANSAAALELSGKTLSVRSVAAGGRRRAGFGFGKEATEILADDLTEEQIGLILGDPLLSVTID